VADETREPEPIRWWGAIEGLGAVAAGSALATAIRHPPVDATRVLQLLYVVGHLLALGLLLAGALATGQRVRGWRGTALAFVGACLACLTVIPAELASFAARTAPGVELAITLGGTALAGALAVAAWALGRRLRAGRRSWLALALAFGAALVEPLVLAGLYAGLHLYGLALAGVFAAAGRSAPRDSSRARRLALGLVAVLAVGSVVVPAPAAVRSALARDGGVLLTLLPWPPIVLPVARNVPDDVWLRPSHKRRPVPPSAVERPDAPVVVLVTVDALRADLLARDDVELPELTALANEGVRFTAAHAPGSMTVNTLTTLFAGTHFSQQRWEPGTRWRQLWPLNDPTPRFTEALTEAGVHTVHYPASDWLVGEFGVVRGFAEERYERPAEPREGSLRWNHSDDLLPRMVATLEAIGPEQPAFLYAHWMDPHSPYTRGGVKETDLLGYLAEVEHVDAHLGELRAAIDAAGLAERTFLIVTSDHGEGFGERGRTEHAYGLYEELVHVPLLIAGPGIEPATEERLVSLVDLGPTILDLFGRPTPGHVVGQSLLPWLHGADVELTRPVLAETRLMRSLLTPDGLKVIRDLRRGTLEVYDLQADPGETNDRVGELTPAMERAVSTLDRYFEVHQLREGGYEPPYRP